METNKLISGYCLKYQKTACLNDIRAEYQAPTVTAKQAAKIFRKIYELNDCDLAAREAAFALLLDHRGIPCGYIRVSEGGLTSTPIDARMIVKAALDLNATCVILCHNHPSGMLQASRADCEQTKKLRRTLELFDMSLLDHIILTLESGYSFSENEEIGA